VAASDCVRTVIIVFTAASVCVREQRPRYVRVQKYRAHRRDPRNVTDCCSAYHVQLLRRGRLNLVRVRGLVRFPSACAAVSAAAAAVSSSSPPPVRLRARARARTQHTHIHIYTTRPIRPASPTFTPSPRRQTTATASPPKHCACTARACARLLYFRRNHQERSPTKRKRREGAPPRESSGAVVVCVCARACYQKRGLRARVSTRARAHARRVESRTKLRVPHLSATATSPPLPIPMTTTVIFPKPTPTRGATSCFPRARNGRRRRFGLITFRRNPFAVGHRGPCGSRTRARALR